jgi:hypothetical protein
MVVVLNLVLEYYYYIVVSTPRVPCATGRATLIYRVQMADASATSDATRASDSEAVSTTKDNVSIIHSERLSQNLG